MAVNTSTPRKDGSEMPDERKMVCVAADMLEKCRELEPLPTPEADPNYVAVPVALIDDDGRPYRVVDRIDIPALETRVSNLETSLIGAMAAGEHEAPRIALLETQLSRLEATVAQLIARNVAQ